MTRPKTGKARTAARYPYVYQLEKAVMEIERKHGLRQHEGYAIEGIPGATSLAFIEWDQTEPVDAKKFLKAELAKMGFREAGLLSNEKRSAFIIMVPREGSSQQRRRSPRKTRFPVRKC